MKVNVVEIAGRFAEVMRNARSFGGKLDLIHRLEAIEDRRVLNESGVLVVSVSRATPFDFGIDKT